jgi:hypothetical protein
MNSGLEKTPQNRVLTNLRRASAAVVVAADAVAGVAEDRTIAWQVNDRARESKMIQSVPMSAPTSTMMRPTTPSTILALMPMTTIWRKNQWPKMVAVESRRFSVPFHRGMRRLDLSLSPICNRARSAGRRRVPGRGKMDLEAAVAAAASSE